MRLEEEKLAGEVGQTALPGRQKTARGVMAEGLGDGLAVEENDPVRPADAVTPTAATYLRGGMPAGSRP
jgi:hypothetical protein